MPNETTTHFSARKRLIVAAVSACFTSAPAWSNPTAPQVVNGSASFNQAGKLLTVNNSNGAIINWNTFSIGVNETTRFNQASAASSVLNRVITNDPSVLLGTLSSNGRVWLVNPAGIMVGQGARIDVAGFIASTLNVRNEDFLANRLNFQATPNAGKIENYGQITTPSGGSVYLIASAVENHGIINAPNGEVILAAGQTAQLIDTGTPGVKVDITGAEGNVTNLGEIVAEAGRIGMAGVLVKNSGTLNASSLVKEGGRIFLKASRDAYVDGAGRIVASGTKGGSIEVLGNNVTLAEQAVIDASGEQQGGGHILLKADMNLGLTAVAGSLLAKGGAQGGDGGFIETSGARVKIADSARVNTLALHGKAGTWLIDPNDYTIAASGGDITGVALGTNLDGGSIIIQSSNGAAAGNGDIFVNDAVAWSANNTLTLSAARNIAVNANITATGNSAGLNLYYGGTDGTTTPIGGTSYSLNNGAAITLSGTNPTLWIGNGQYTVINSLGSAGSTTGTDLQGMSVNLAGRYALGSNIDATATSSWNFNSAIYNGFAPVGTNSDFYFSGSFDGLNHTISNLTINRPTTLNPVGLFGYIVSGSVVRNVGLVGGSVTGQNYVGGLVGYNSSGTVSNSYATGIVSGTDYVGGLVGYNYYGTVSNSHATGSVTGNNYVGGLAGYFNDDGDSGHNITNAYATGSVTGNTAVGGLVGLNAGIVSISYATGGVNGSGSVGGLIGTNSGSLSSVSNSYATGSVSSSGSYGGGLVGSNHGSVSNSYATGSVTGNNYVGGLVAYNAGTVSLSYATGIVSGTSTTDYVGGLVGYHYSGTIDKGYATGNVSGRDSVGGLVGYNYSTTSNSYATGGVSGRNSVGGLVGESWYQTISNTYATGSVSGSSNVGGLAGLIWSSNITNSYATGIVSGTTFVGGLLGVGYSGSTITNSFWNKETTGQATSYGGGTGRTTAQMKQFATFSGWGSNIANAGGSSAIWRIYEGSTYPLLRSFLTPLTVTAASGSKIYDGTDAGMGVSYSVTPDLSKVLGSTTGASKNVGTHTITASGLYSSQQGYDISYVDGAWTITARALSITAAGANKVYDGLTNATVTLDDNRVAGDVLTIGNGSASYLDKNVGIAKTVNVSGITLTGTDAGNYTFNTTAATTADITVRPLSTWIGGASGNWSVAANWDALPDLSNVLAVSVPTGKSVTYDTAAGSTNLDSLTAAGLSIAGGSLTIAKSLTVNSSFSQTGGTLAFGGGASASITQASGDLNLPAFAVAHLSLNAPAGAIAQSGRIAALTLNTQSQGATTLTNPDNQISDRVDMTAGGPLKLWGSGDLNLGAINAGANAVEIKAGGAILKAPGTETSTNITAGAADLTSTFGGAAGDLAISADTQITGALTATVGADADFGGIRIKNSGAQPVSVTLTDNALAGASVSFQNTGDITSTSGFTLKTLMGGDLALLSNGNLTWDGGSLVTPSGSVLMSAEGSIAATGALSSPVDLALSSSIAITVNGSVSTNGTGTAALIAPSVAINGSVNAADDVGIIAATINLGAGSSTGAGHDVIFAAENILATNATVTAGHDISAAVTGDLHLNGSGFTAGNDIFINMMGATSTLYLNDVAGPPRSFLWAQDPSTIHLDFPARGSDGMVVDGVAVDPLTFATAAGGSGLFYGAAMAPATLGAGLEVSYLGVAMAGTTTVAPTVIDAVMAAISSSITPVTRATGPLPSGTFGPNLGPQTGSGGTLGSGDIGGTEGTFGGSTDAKKDEDDKNKTDKETGLKKQADKPTAKKLATCS